MSAQWLHAWFPVVAMMLQVMFWGLAMPRLVSRKTIAIMTFTHLPEDPDW